MKITGERAAFAFEWKLDSYDHRYYFGYLFFWINNIIVGRPGELVTMSIVTSYLSDFLKYSGRRIYDNSENLDSHTLFDNIYEVFYNGSLRSITDYENVSSFRETFWLDQVGEYSLIDKVGLILVDEAKRQRQRLIWKVLDSKEIYEFFVPEMFFDSIASQFLKEVGYEIAGFKDQS